MVIRHVLFDADGVLQDLPGGWYAAMERYVGGRSREFLHATWEEELPMLAGVGEYRPLLEQRLRDHGVDATVDEVLEAVWYRIELDERSMEIVRTLREMGYGVHLGTNQESLRATHMKSALGYDVAFEKCFYSCDIGYAKPDPAFFTETARLIGDDPGSVLFIDDTVRNVDGAREAGMAAVHWTIPDGHDALVDALRGHGVEMG